MQRPCWVRIHDERKRTVLRFAVVAILMAVVAVLLAQAVRAKLFDVPTGLLILVFGCGGSLVYGSLVYYETTKEDNNT